jgi:hypothetical protein
MLDESTENRPTAAELYAEIVSECTSQTFIFCGICCLVEVKSSGIEDDDEDDFRVKLH